MFITYPDGTTVEGILLSRVENKIRVAQQGSDDVMEFTDFDGIWISEDLEVVKIEFAWEGKTPEQLVTEADCVCSEELAARLLRLLFPNVQEADVEAPSRKRAGHKIM